MKILIAEDDTTSRLVLAATLRKLGHSVTAVADGSAAWDAWQRDQYALVISDWMMPGLDGPSLCRKVRETQRSHYTYIVLLTALGGKGRYFDGIEAGADDFLTKPFEEDLLGARLHVAQRILALHDTLRDQAMQDRLTGLWNRGAITDSLRHELERSARSKQRVGVLVADLDHFKRINDTYGHPVGDDVLREAARRMQSALRSYDQIGRYGGEEFLVLAPGAGPAQSRMVGERICESLRASPIHTSVGPLHITVSIGVAVSDGHTGDGSALISAADEALYRAKRAGRDRVEVIEFAVSA